MACLLPVNWAWVSCERKANFGKFLNISGDQSISNWGTNSLAARASSADLKGETAWVICEPKSVLETWKPWQATSEMYSYVSVLGHLHKHTQDICYACTHACTHKFTHTVHYAY
jgi:hypothetical protein